MDQNSSQPQIDPKNIPTPAGYTDDGHPYWFVQGQKIFWAEMQQVLLQLASQQNKNLGNGRSLEGGPQLTPFIEGTMDVFQDTLDANINKAPDQNFEKKDTGIETRAEQPTSVSTAKPAAPAVQKPEDNAPSLIGDSPKLKVPVNNPTKMQEFILQNEKGSPKSSNTFLSAFLKKILQALTISE